MNIRVPRREMDGLFEFLLRAREVPVMDILDPSKCVMGFAERRVDLYRMKGRRFCLSQPFLGREQLISGGPAISLSHFRVGQTVRRIGVDSLVKVVDRLIDSVRTQSVREVLPLQKSVMSFRLERTIRGELGLLLRRELDTNLLRNRPRNFVLQEEHVAQAPFIALRPYMPFRGGR